MSWMNGEILLLDIWVDFIRFFAGFAGAESILLCDTPGDTLPYCTPFYPLRLPPRRASLHQLPRI